MHDKDSTRSDGLETKVHLYKTKLFSCNVLNIRGVAVFQNVLSVIIKSAHWGISRYSHHTKAKFESVHHSTRKLFSIKDLSRFCITTLSLKSRSPESKLPRKLFKAILTLKGCDSNPTGDKIAQTLETTSSVEQSAILDRSSPF